MLGSKNSNLMMMIFENFENLVHCMKIYGRIFSMWQQMHTCIKKIEIFEILFISCSCACDLLRCERKLVCQGTQMACLD